MLPVAASAELVAIVSEIAINAMATTTTPTTPINTTSQKDKNKNKDKDGSAQPPQKDQATSSPARSPAPWANYLPRTFVASTFEQSANAVRLLADAARSPHAYFPPAIRYDRQTDRLPLPPVNFLLTRLSPPGIFLPTIVTRSPLDYYPPHPKYTP